MDNKHFIKWIPHSDAVAAYDMKDIGWQSYVLAAFLPPVWAIGLFWLKFALHHAVSLDALGLCIGVVLSVAAVSISFFAKCLRLLPLLFTTALGLWVCAPFIGDPFASALFSFGIVCLMGETPQIAAALAGVPQKSGMSP